MPKTAEPTVDPLLTLEDVAERLGVHIRTLHRFVADGRLPAYRIGPRLVRIRTSDVEAFLEPVQTRASAS